jgi:hypothetical protein
MDSSNKTINLLQNIPQLEGVDSVLVGEVIVRLYADFTYRIAMSNLWQLSQVFQGEKAQQGNVAQIDLIPAYLRTYFAAECFKSSIVLTQAAQDFNWQEYISNLSQVSGDQARQTERRAG